MCEHLRDHLAELSGSRTVPRLFVHAVFLGGCDDVQELECANFLTRVVEASGGRQVEQVLSEARPVRDSWPDTVDVAVVYNNGQISLETSFKVDCHWAPALLKRHALEACQEHAELLPAPDMLMLCEGLPFPLRQSVGAHARLIDQCVISLIERSQFHSSQVDYNQF